MIQAHYTPEEDRNPFSDVPWQCHEDFICTNKQYKEMVDITIENKGLMWPGTYSYANREEISVGVMELIHAIEEDSTVINMVTAINDRIYEDETYGTNLFRDLYFTGAPEKYIKTFFSALYTDREFLLHCLKLSDDRDIIMGSPRLPELVEKRNESKRRVIPFQSELYVCDRWFNWADYGYEKRPAKSKLLEYIKSEYKLELKLVTFNTWLQRNKGLLNEETL